MYLGGVGMVEVYFYMPAEQVDTAVECGLKLSEWYSRETIINGEMKKSITALLNPRDDQEKYGSHLYKCLKLQVQPKYCCVADSLLYLPGLNHPEVMELYTRSIIPIEQYTFGTYRLPECLITSTVLGDQISLPGKGLDTPVLYSNSQELYFNNLLEGMKEEHDDLNDTLLYFFFRKLCEEGKVSCVEDPGSGLAVFTGYRDGYTYTLKIPNLSSY